MHRSILAVLALGSVFACSANSEDAIAAKSDGTIAVKPVSMSPEAIAAAQEPAVAKSSAPTTAEDGVKAPGTIDDGERVFGAPLQGKGEPVTVATLLDDPKPYLGKVVKAKGTVSRVCEKAGCWLELATVQGGLGLRVPMANHAFFIPEDAVGRPAIVEGQLSAQALSSARKEHLAAEGAQALEALSLAATTVVVQ